jgi:Holliday junction resolvase
MMRKGARTERELVQMLKKANFGAIRIAGSGKMDNAPDILAGEPDRLLIIECKSSKKSRIYVSAVEVKNVISYAQKFGGEPWYAFRFNHKEWKFVPASELLNNTKVSPDSGITFSNFLGKGT